MSKVMHLQQRLLELRERECLAKEHNRQLMQQFEEAQDTMRKMLERTAAMKLLRNEYQRYYQSSTHLDYQLKHRTEAGQENKIGGSLNTQKKNLEDQENSNAQLLPLQGLGNMPRKTRTYQESDSPLELQTQVQTQTAAFPKGPSNQPWDIAKSSPFFLHSNLSQPKQHPFTLGQQLPYIANSYLSGPNDQLYTDQALPLSAQEKEAVPRRPPSSKSDRSEDSNSHLQELDVKPVRLSSGQAESKSSSPASSQRSTEKRKMRVRKSIRSSSSDGDQNSSHQSSQSSAVHTGLNAKAINAVDEDSEKSISQISKKSSQLDLNQRKNESENSLANHNKDYETDVEESESDEGLQSPQKEHPGSTKLENTKLQETEHSISDQSSQVDAEGDLEKGQGKESSQEDEGADHQHQDDIPKCTSSEEDTDSETDESEGQDKEDQEDVEDLEKEQSDVEGKESSQEDEGEDHQHQEDIPQCTSSDEDKDSQTDDSEEQDKVDQDDEEESELSDGEEEHTMEDMEESKKEQDQSKNTSHRTEDSDSEDGIIAPAPQTRSKTIYVIPEHPAEQDEEEEVSDSKSSSDDNQISNDCGEDDIENLLAPQQQTHKGEPKADDKPKAASDTVIRVKQAGHTDHHTDSDEFDDFYD